MTDAHSSRSLDGRTLYIPQMTYAGAHMLAAAFHSIGVDGRVSPDSDHETLELGGRYTSGEECLPMKVTLGDFMKIVNAEGFDPKKTAFLMPTANGPCRFGQYRELVRKVLDDLGHTDVLIISPTSNDGYAAFGEHARTFVRTAWRAMIIGDILTKALLRTRPYEIRRGDTDEVFLRALRRMGEIISVAYPGAGDQMERLVRGLEICRAEFEGVAADYREPKLLIGVVGEIFCRLNDFSNASLIRKLEEHGCEAWLADVAEWVWYTNDEMVFRGKEDGVNWLSPSRWKIALQNTFQRRDEHALYEGFDGYFAGYEEPHHVSEVLDRSRPYLPREGALGEMVLSTGKTVYLWEHGADGIVDISPFTCMNGIITEAIYPKMSRECDDIPIRVFYFDGIAADLDRDVGIFVELTKTYRRRKKRERIWPHRRQDVPVGA